jgi:hypothetical protein
LLDATGLVSSESWGVVVNRAQKAAIAGAGLLIADTLWRGLPKARQGQAPPLMLGFGVIVGVWLVGIRVIRSLRVRPNLSVFAMRSWYAWAATAVAALVSSHFAPYWLTSILAIAALAAMCGGAFVVVRDVRNEDIKWFYLAALAGGYVLLLSNIARDLLRM